MTTPFEIKQLGKEDLASFTALVRLFNEVFEEEEPTIAGDAHLLELLCSPSFVALAAVAETAIVGGLTAYELPLVHADRSEILLYDLAVKAEYQRKGIGRGLLDALKEYCSRHGIREFFVLANEEDKHAVEFYHSTGGRSELVVNFVYAAGSE